MLTKALVILAAASIIGVALLAAQTAPKQKKSAKANRLLSRRRMLIHFRTPRKDSVAPVTETQNPRRLGCSLFPAAPSSVSVPEDPEQRI